MFWSYVFCLLSSKCEAVHVHTVKAPDGGEWSRSHLSHFTPGKNPIIHSLGAWVGSIASRDVRREKFLQLHM